MSAPRVSGVHPAALALARLLAECEQQARRRSGPGGQHRNKVETAVVLIHRPTGVRSEASERRSREENRSAALFRLRVNLALAVRVPRGVGTADASPASGPREPTALWRSRCRAGRISVNERHADFPALLAEALDTLAAHDLDAGSAAAALACSPSQLVRLLAREPRALATLNAARAARGLHPLQA